MEVIFVFRTKKYIKTKSLKTTQSQACDIVRIFGATDQTELPMVERYLMVGTMFATTIQHQNLVQITLKISTVNI